MYYLIVEILKLQNILISDTVLFYIFLRVFLDIYTVSALILTVLNSISVKEILSSILVNFYCA